MWRVIGNGLASAGCVVCLMANPAMAAAGPQPVPAPQSVPLPFQAPDPSSLAGLAAALAKEPTTIAAKVDGKPITLADVSSQLRSLPPGLRALPPDKLFNLALNDLIQQKAAADAARRLGLGNDPWVQQRIASDEDHELISALVGKEAPHSITKQAIAALYQKEIAGKPGLTEVKLRAIVSLTEADANDALRHIHDGMSFAAAARAYSHDSSKAAGGEIGYVRKSQLTPEIGAVAFSLAPGQTTAYPVFSRGLWYVLHCDGRQSTPTPTLAQATPQLWQQLFQKAAIKILHNALAHAKVQNFGVLGSVGQKPAAK